MELWRGDPPHPKKKNKNTLPEGGGPGVPGLQIDHLKIIKISRKPFVFNTKTSKSNKGGPLQSCQFQWSTWSVSWKDGFEHRFGDQFVMIRKVGGKSVRCVGA